VESPGNEKENGSGGERNPLERKMMESILPETGKTAQPYAMESTARAQGSLGEEHCARKKVN